MNPVAETAAATSQLSSNLSDDGFHRATAILNDTAKVDVRTALIPDWVCDSTIARLDAEPRYCTPQQAALLAAELISAYPELILRSRNKDEAREFKAYSVKLIEAFSVHPYSVGKAVVHGGTGLPSKLAYSPKPADVAKAIAAEEARLALIRANAFAHKAERARRLAQQAEDEAWRRERERVPAAERAARVQALLRVRAL